MRKQLGFLLLAVFSSGILLAQDVDNTRANKQDPGPTADQAANSKSDREIMKNIRKSIVDDKSLSTYGHNVKVISQHGRVTLRGPVRSEEESKSIQAKAEEVAGAGNVTNNLSVKGETASR